MAKFDLKSFDSDSFAKYMGTIPRTKLDLLIKSGAVVSNSLINEAFSGTNAPLVTVPFVGRVSTDGVVNYDGLTDITASSLDTYEMSIPVVGRAKAWVERDFSTELTGLEFLDFVGQQLAEFYDDLHQDMLISILKGVFAMDANKAEKEFVASHTNDITGIGDGMVSVTTLNDTVQKALGDHKNKFSLVVMHSAVATNIENLKLLKYNIADANGLQTDITMGTWNGRLVVVDDGVETSVDPSDDTKTIYTSYVLGQGAIGYKDVGADVPYEMDRDPAKYGGETYLYSRDRVIIHPMGLSFKLKGVNSPSNAQLEAGTSWTLANDGSGNTVSPKSIAIAQIKSFG